MKFSQFEPRKPIAIFASGDSKNSIDKYILHDIRDSCYTIGLNYFNMFEPDMLFWLDREVTEYWDIVYRNACAYPAFCTRRKSIDKNKQLWIADKICYFFDQDEDKLELQMTAFHIIQLIRTYLPNTYVLLFGYDCDVNNLKCMKNNEIKVSPTDDVALIKNQKRHLEDMITFVGHDTKKHPAVYSNWLNCNPNSKIDSIQKCTPEEGIASLSVWLNKEHKGVNHG